MQVTDSPTPNALDIKRKLQNAEHELVELCNAGPTPNPADGTHQALYRVREAIAHLSLSDRKAV